MITKDLIYIFLFSISTAFISTVVCKKKVQCEKKTPVQKNEPRSKKPFRKNLYFLLIS